MGRIWFDLKCLKFYQFKRVTWWCLCVLESILESILESTIESVLKSIMLENILKKIMVSRNFRQAWRWA